MDLNAWKPHAEAMQAYHRGNADAVIVVYDDFERDEVPVSYFFRGPDQFPPYEQLALDLCRGRVLDVGAGSGCHSLELQTRGFDVTAIEVLPELVEILRERGVRQAEVASWMDVEAGTFDTVLMLMNGLGLAETLTGLRKFFREAGRLLRPGGQIIADSTDVRVRMDPEAGRTGELRRRDGRYIGELHFQLEFDGRKGAPFPQLYVDPDTLLRAAQQGGWHAEIVRSPDGSGHYLVRLTAGASGRQQLSGLPAGRDKPAQ
jgi:SAM-dependent methyltransferase